MTCAGYKQLLKKEWSEESLIEKIGQHLQEENS